MKYLFLLLVFHFSQKVFASEPVILSSPDKKIVFQFEILEGQPGYRVLYENKEIISFSKFQFSSTQFPTLNVRLDQTSRKDSSEQYQLMTGRTSAVNDLYRQVTLHLADSNNSKLKFQIQVRAFNDGVAFRYQFPKDETDSLFLSEEKTEFRLTGNPVVHALILPDFTTSHEGLYQRKAYQSFPIDSLTDLPVLAGFSDSVYVSITEAALLNYGGMYLQKKATGWVSVISPNITHPGYVVVSALPAVSPWRVIMISRRPGRFLESNLLTDLAPPQSREDFSWLKPGKTTFPWWNGNVTPDTLNAPGNNFVTQQYYIDFCARSNIEFHSVVEYGLHQWYQDDGINFMPGPNSDVLKPVPGLDMKQVCDYAKSLGVGIRVWVHWKALYPKLDSAFALFQTWGIAGLMVDFMDRDDQDMVNIQTSILEKAAEHHLHIQFHGAYKPTGLSRTYPNEFTREGALNYEHDKWNPKGVSPDHDLDIAFTRSIAGSTDYHLGGFRAVLPEKFRAQYTRPLVLGTRCHMLAMYVVLENANAMVCDYPAAYEQQMGFEFIKLVPTTWDETRALQAFPDNYLVMARRKAKTWWIGGINNMTARHLTLDFSFLETGSWLATIYQDSPKQPLEPDEILIKTIPVNSGSKLDVMLASGGGFTMKIEKQ